MDARLLARLALAFVIGLLGACAVLAPDQPEAARQSASLAQQQHQRAQASSSALDGRRVWFAGFAMNATSHAFAGDLHLVERRLSALEHPLLVYEFSNERQTSGLHRPFATPSAFGETMQRIGEQLRRDDLVLVLVSTHGSKGLLSVNAANKDYAPFGAAQFERALKPLGDTPTIIVLSACHAGSFIPRLARDNRIILAAASAERTSFGCSFEDQNTWFIDALFGPQFDASKSLAELMAQAQATVAAREARMKFVPSEPQIWIGPKVRWLAERPLRDWWRP
jgi:hypothetical protein